MEIGLVAKRYSRALMEFAEQKGKVDQVYRDVLSIKEALKDNSTMEKAVEEASREMKQFLQLVIRNGRVNCLKFILYSFISLYRKKNGILPASLKQATPSAELEHKMAELLGTFGYTKIDFETEVNPSLIGGFILQLDDKRFDASLSTQLKTISKEFETKNRKLL